MATGINLKKDDSKIKYLAKQKLPGNIVKDDIIVYDTKKKTYTLEKTGKVVPYNCAEETAFFKLQDIPKFQYGELVFILHGLQLVKTIDSKMGKSTSKTIYVNANEELKIISNSNGSYVVELVEQPGVKVTISEKLLLPCVYWYFYNTDGILIKALIGRFPKKEIWMKLIDQYFTSKSEAETWKVTRHNYTKKSA